MAGIREIDMRNLSERARKGELRAVLDTAHIYEYGVLLPKDAGLAFFWYYKAASENKDAYAQRKVACKFYSGEGVTRDFSKAVYWIKKAARQNDLEAIYIAGLFTSNEHVLGIAAQRGHPEACFTLGKCALKRGDDDTAADMLARGARRGHRRCAGLLEALQARRGLKNDEPPENFSKVTSLLEWKFRKGIMR